MDGPSAQGFLSLTGPLAPRVVVSPSRAMSMKSALRIYLSASYVMKCIPLARRAVVKVLYKLAPSINLEAPSTTLSGIAAVSRVDGIRLLCPPLTEPYVRFSRIRLLE